jgi:hypothetical protein
LGGSATKDFFNLLAERPRRTIDFGSLSWPPQIEHIHKTRHLHLTIQAQPVGLTGDMK